MIIAGAKGLAKELLQILKNSKTTTDLVFFDDVNVYDPNLLYDKYPVLRTENK